MGMMISRYSRRYIDVQDQKRYFVCFDIDRFVCDSFGKPLYYS